MVAKTLGTLVRLVRLTNCSGCSVSALIDAKNVTVASTRGNQGRPRLTARISTSESKGARELTSLPKRTAAPRKNDTANPMLSGAVRVLTGSFPAVERSAKLGTAPAHHEQYSPAATRWASPPTAE